MTSGNTLKSDFERDGFVIVENFLDPSEIEAARADARAAAAVLKPDPHRPDREFWGVLSQRLTGNDIDRPGLNAIAEKPRLAEVARQILGDDCVYGDQSMQVYLPHLGHRQSWHSDTDPDDSPFFYLTMTTYLQDQTRQLGMTRLVPGSHHAPIEKSFPDHDDLPGQAAADVRAGSLCAFHSLTWHSAMENFSDEPRFVVVNVFSCPQFSRDRAGQYYGRMRHARGARRSGRPTFDHPTDQGSYPWPQAYDLAQMPYMANR